MNRSVDDLEQEVVESRERLDRTLDRIQGRLSGAGSISDVIGTARRTLAPREVYDAAVTAIRRDPVPILLICAGAGWLIYKALGADRGRTVAVAPRPARTPVPIDIAGHPRRS